MNDRIKWLIGVAFILALLFGRPIDGQPVPDELLRSVGQFAENYPNEVALCLHEDHFEVPFTRAATRSALNSKRCEEDILAFWHSHPAAMVEDSRFKVFFNRNMGRMPEHPRDGCYMSRADVNTAKTRKPAWFIVQVDRDTYCWWSSAQVEAIDPVKPLNWPPEKQTSWS